MQKSRIEYGFLDLVDCFLSSLRACAGQKRRVYDFVRNQRMMFVLCGVEVGQ